MSALYYLVSFVVVIVTITAVHEYGHYLAARLCGVKILRFSLGFGRVLKSRRIGPDQTEWAISAIPLGGYVKMLDEREGEVAGAERHRAFNVQPIYKRSIIVLAGPLANLLLAVLIYWGWACVGTRDLPAVIGEVVSQSAMQRAGVQPGDRVLEVDGRVIRGWSDFKWEMVDQAVSGKTVTLRLDRGGVPVSDVLVDASFIVLGEHVPDPLQQLGAEPSMPKLPAIAQRVLPGSAASRAGMMAGDRVTKIDGDAIDDWGQLVRKVSASAGKPLRFTIQREGGMAAVELQVTPESPPLELGIVRRVMKWFGLDTPESNAETARIGKIGVEVRQDPSLFMRATIEVRYGVLEGLQQGFKQTWNTAAFSLKVIWRILTGHISARNVSGPLTIADYAGQSARAGGEAFVRFLALISVSVGVLNLLPIPILDGGHLLYHAAEFIRGKPVSARVEEYGQRVGMALLAGLMALAFFNDFNRFLFG